MAPPKDDEPGLGVPFPGVMETLTGCAVDQTTPTARESEARTKEENAGKRMGGDPVC